MLNMTLNSKNKKKIKWIFKFNFFKNIYTIKGLLIWIQFLKNYIKTNSCTKKEFEFVWRNKITKEYVIKISFSGISWLIFFCKQLILVKYNCKLFWTNKHLSRQDVLRYLQQTQAKPSGKFLNNNLPFWPFKNIYIYILKAFF